MPLEGLAARVAAEFKEHYGRPPRWIAAAPGRVNVIGEHADHNDGFVQPMAIERYTVTAVDSASSSSSFSFFDIHFKETATIDVSAAVAKGPPKWSNYVRGVLAGFQSHGARLPALDVAILSTVPLGGGLTGGVYGCRMTGGGGGCCVALVKADYA